MAKDHLERPAQEHSSRKRALKRPPESRLVPDIVLDSILEITPEWLRTRGIMGLSVDLDNTLALYGQKGPMGNTKTWVATILGAGIPIVVISNNSESRCASFCKPLGVPFVYGAGKPRKKGYFRVAQVMRLPAEQIAHVGDQVFTDVWGAKRSGMTAILVQPVCIRGHFFLSVRHRLEMPFISKAIKRRKETT